MGEPIRFKTQRDVREELFRKLEAAPADHAAALLSAYELLQEAHDHGVLDTLRGAIGAGETFVSTAAGYANTPAGIRTMRNLLAMVRLLGEIDPAVLDSLMKSVGEAQQRQQATRQQEPPSLWQIFRRLGSQDSRRTLALLAGFTEAFGSAQK